MRDAGSLGALPHLGHGVEVARLERGVEGGVGGVHLLDDIGHDAIVAR